MCHRALPPWVARVYSSPSSLCCFQDVQHTAGGVQRVLRLLHATVLAADVTVHRCIGRAFYIDYFEWVARPGKERARNDGDQRVELGRGGGVHPGPGEVKLLPVKDGLHRTIIHSLTRANLE